MKNKIQNDKFKTKYTSSYLNKLDLKSYAKICQPKGKLIHNVKSKPKNQILDKNEEVELFKIQNRDLLGSKCNKVELEDFYFGKLY